MTRDEKIAQAREWRDNKWDIDAIADELDVSETTVKNWLNDDYRKANIARVSAWARGPGKDKRREIKRRYVEGLDPEKRKAARRRSYLRVKARAKAEALGVPVEKLYEEWGCA